MRKIILPPRKTKETKVQVSLNLDGKGKTEIDTGIPFFDHMLELVAFNSLFDLKIKAEEIVRQSDKHHLIEDVGLCFGEAFKKTLADKKGIERYGSVSAALLPMDEVLAQVVVDISGRPGVYFGRFRPLEVLPTLISVGTRKSVEKKEIGFDPERVKDFFRAFASEAKITLHINVPVKGESIHHTLEAIFKAFGRALRDAVKINLRIKDVPSTKGKL